MITIKAKKRPETGHKLQKLRKQGLVPGVVYGRKIDSLPITLSLSSVENLIKEAGESVIINLDIEGEKPKKVLIHEVERHPLTNRVSHVDFYQIREKEKIQAEVGIEFIGQSLAVKEKGGILLTNLDHLDIEALPNDLLPKITVDISSLNEIGQEILVKDLPFPPGLKISQSPEEVVVKILPPYKEEVLKEEEIAVPEKTIAGESKGGETKEEGESKGAKAEAK